MAISNLTQGLRPGICTSTTRPTAPYEGQAIFETDTDRVLYWSGTAWYPAWNTAWGKVGYASNSSMALTTTSDTDLTNLTTTFTAISNRLYKISGFVFQKTTEGTNPIDLFIKDGSNNILQSSIINCQIANFDYTNFASLVTTFSGGSTTVKLSGRRRAGSGTVTTSGFSNSPAQLIVEDIGPA